MKVAADAELRYLDFIGPEDFARPADSIVFRMVEIVDVVHVGTDFRCEKFCIHRRLFRARVAVQPGKVRKRERLGRWRLRRPALPFFCGLWPQHCDATIGKRVGVSRRCPRDETRTASPGSRWGCVRRSWLRGRRISNRKCRRVALGLEVGNALFQLLNAVQQPPLAFRQRSRRFDLRCCRWFGRRFSFAVVGKRNNGNRASAKHCRQHERRKSFHTENVHSSLLSFLAQSQRSRDPLIRSPFASIARWFATARLFFDGRNLKLRDRSTIKSFGSLPGTNDVWPFLLASLTSIVISYRCRLGLRVSHPLK